jgi:hypothetical protein
MAFDVFHGEAFMKVESMGANIYRFPTARLPVRPTAERGLLDEVERVGEAFSQAIAVWDRSEEQALFIAPPSIGGVASGKA